MRCRFFARRSLLCPLHDSVFLLHPALLGKTCGGIEVTLTTRSQKKGSPTTLTSKPSRQKQDDHNNHDQSQSSAWVISPRPAVRPRGQRAEQQQNQNYQKNCVHRNLSV